MPDDMPETRELPALVPNPEGERRRGRTGWFMRGFVAAAAVFAAFLYFSGYFGSADTNQADASRTIIVGN